VNGGAIRCAASRHCPTFSTLRFVERGWKFVVQTPCARVIAVRHVPVFERRGKVNRGANATGAPPSV